MRAHSILIPGALLLALGACTNEIVKKVDEMADRACECPDAGCADKVEKEFWDYVKTRQKRGTQDERDEIKGHYNRMRDCIAKVRSSAPAAGQPAEAKAPAAGASPTETK